MQEQASLEVQRYAQQRKDREIEKSKHAIGEARTLDAKKNLLIDKKERASEVHPVRAHEAGDNDVAAPGSECRPGA
jgi:hypothetical protein